MSGRERWVDQAIRSLLNQTTLSEEQERALLAQARHGATDSDRHIAVTQLWRSYSKLVVAIANRHRRPGIDLLDLVGAGHLGLHSAIAAFDPAKSGGRLGPFAAVWIRWAIKDTIRRDTTAVRLPESRPHRQLAQFAPSLVRDARESCRRECIEESSHAICERIGARVGLDASDVERSLRLIDGGMLSLNGSEQAGRLEETLPDESALSEDDVIFRLDREKARARASALAQEILGARERAVFLARCMPGDERPSLEVLAQGLGVTAERVHQLEVSARGKIATALAGEGFRVAGPAIQAPKPAMPRRGVDRRAAPVHRRPAQRAASMTA